MDLPYLEDLGGGCWHVVIPCRHGYPPLRLKPGTLARYLAILEHAEVCHDLLRQLDEDTRKAAMVRAINSAGLEPQQEATDDPD